jgi:hypothetical protein
VALSGLKFCLEYPPSLQIKRGIYYCGEDAINALLRAEE